METKLLEIRDRATFIPAIAIEVSARDHYLLRHAGYGVRPLILLASLNKGPMTYNAHDWADRTMKASHLWIIDHWEELKSGSVVDVEFILGETTEPKQSVQVEHGGEYAI